MKTILAIIIFPIFCLLLSFYVLTTDPVFTYLLLENSESIEPTKQVFSHFDGKTELPDVFNEGEKSHLIDVRRRIHYAYYLLDFLTIILVYCMIGNSQKVIKTGTILLLIILLMASIIPFEKIFTMFHQIAFPQGNWMFPAGSKLINFYPTAFFANYSIAIALYSIVVAGAVIIVSRKG